MWSVAEAAVGSGRRAASFSVIVAVMVRPTMPVFPDDYLADVLRGRELSYGQQ